MSYAASLLANYPSSYATSSLLSDNLVQRTTYDTIYPSSVPFLNDNRLLSDQLTYNPLNYNPTTTTYQPSLYPSNVYPTTKRNPIKGTTQFSKPLATNQRKLVPPNDSYASLNDITEYSDSLATASNTNTASTVARSFNGNLKKTFTNHNKSNNQHIWSPAQAKIQKPQPINQKKTPVEQSDEDRTPIPIHQTKQQQHPNNLPEPNNQTSAVDIEAWLNDTKKESPVDDELAEQAWSSKIEHLHQMKAQHEKDKVRLSRALPISSKRKETKPVVSKTRPPNDPNYNKSTYDSYFDSIFDGDYFRKPFSSEHAQNSSLHQTGVRKNKPTTNSFNSGTSKPSKFAPQKKSLQYEPPTIKRTQPAITTSSWRKNWPYQNQYPFESVYPYYLHNEFNHREFTQKDTEERYREALLKVRADRAEQQQKESEENEKITKRLNYSDYVRRSTKEGSLQNPVKPSPWSDFMDLKKGNVYTISKEEKKQLYNQSKNYGERVRYRNFALQYAGETSRSHRHSVPLLDDEYQESESDGDTTRPPATKSHSQTPRRPDSAEGHKSRSRSNNTNHNANRTSRSNPPAGQVQRRRSDNGSDRESKPSTKKKTVRYAKVDSSGRVTASSENESGNESADNRSQRNGRMRNHPSNDDLFTLREEKTLETIETSRYKKR